MIKINLTRSRVSASSGTEVAIDFNTSESKAPILIKLLLMAIFVLGIMYYRSVRLDQIGSETNLVAQEMAAVQAQLDQKKQEAETMPGLEAEAKELNNRLGVLRSLSRLRLTEVKSLDFIQSIIPERVWLQAVDYKQGQFRIAGFSTGEDDVSKFLKGLESGPFFKDVILFQSREQKSDQGTVKAFEISFRAETQN